MTDNTSPPPIFRVILSTRYTRDLKRLKRSHVDLSPLDAVIRKLERNLPLDIRHHDHALKGVLAGFRACHIKPDWLLLYTKKKEALVLLLVATGTHRDTLGIE